MRYIVFLISLLLCLSVFAEEQKYKVSEIPAELLVDANAVIRLNNEDFIVYSESKAIEKVIYAVTILNDKADNLATFNEYYDNSISLKILSIRIYDKDGKLIKKIKDKDILDIASNPDYILLGDSRIKYYNYKSATYPYTMEYEYEKKHTSLISYTHWYPMYSYETSVESACLKVEIPNNLKARYRDEYFPSKLVLTNKEKTVNYCWKVSNITSIKSESFSPDFSERFPNVTIAPSVFEYEGYLGDMSTWNSYGKWSYKLLEARDFIEENTKAEILALVSGIKDKKEIVKKVYQYVQNKTRYICISLGIGGFQPFPASDVDKNGYGDCKALSNYTKALLKIVGIESFYTEVGAGESTKIKYKDFASASQTNHIILCVPMQKDSIWLECTSQDSPFNYLGKFTSDRYALLIKEDGGELVKTHHYNINDNLKESVSNVELLKDGSLKYNVLSKYHSLYFDDISAYFSISEKKQEESLRKSLDISDYNIDKFNFRMLNDGKYSCGERELNLTLNKCVSVTNKRIFLPVNLITQSYYHFADRKERKFKIVEDECYTVSDTIYYKIPDYYELESMPKNKDIESKYGKYKSTYSIGDSKITCVRTMEINKGEYPAEEFKDFYDFHKKIRKEETVMIVLIDKN